MRERERAKVMLEGAPQVENAGQHSSEKVTTFGIGSHIYKINPLTLPFSICHLIKLKKIRSRFAIPIGTISIWY